MSCRIPI